MLGRLIWFVSLTLGLGLTTHTFGWLAVAILPIGFAWARPNDAAVPLMAAAAGALSWGGMLWLASFSAPIGRVAEVTGAAMQVGAGPLLALTLAFPALVAASAASLTRALLQNRQAA